MATERLVLRIDEKGATVVSRNLENLGRSAQKAGGGVKLLRSALGALGAISAGLVLRDMVKTLAAFSQEMSTVKAITGAVGDSFDDMRMKARELGATTRFSATQAAEGMTFLARAGFETNEILASIGPTLQLAQAGALELGRAADIASNVLTGFNIEASDSARVIDVLALAANSANTNVEQLGEAMSYVAPISATLGVSLEETAAGIQVLSDAGIQASRAGTNLTMVMRKLEAPQGKQKGVLKDLGLELEQVRVSEVGLTQALLNLKAAGASQTQIFELFGRSAAAASVILEGANGKIQAFTQANKDAEGTAAGVAEVMDDNLNGALLAVRSAWEELQLAFGDLGPEAGLTKVLQSLASILRSTASNLKLVADNAIALGVAFGLIKYAPMIQGLVATATASGSLATGLGTVKTALLGLSFNPIVIGAIALTGAVIALNTAFDAFNKLAEEAYDAELEVLKIQIRAKQAINQATREKKEANKALDAYIKNLELENTFSKMTESAQESRISLAEAEGIAKRALSEDEQKRITALLTEKDAIAAANAQRQAELDYLAALEAPAKKYAAELELLNSETVKATLGTERHAAALVALKEKYNMDGGGEAQGAEIIAARVTQLERERTLIGMTNQEREKQIALWQLQDQLREAGAGAETDTEAVELLIAENQALATRAEVINSVLGPQRAFVEQQMILNELIAEGGPDVELYKERLVELKKEMGDIAASPDIDMIGTSAKKSFDTASQSLINFTQTGKLNVRDMVSDILKQLAKLQAMKFLGGLAGGFQIGGLATGGPAQAGTPYMVGEDGPELMIPGQSGTVVPNNKLQSVMSTPSVAAPQMNVKIVNVLDPALVTEAMGSEEGEEVILNVIQKNGSAVKQAVS